MIDKKVLCGKKIIANKIVYCDNIFQQGRGLMLRSKNSVDDTAWWFRFNSPRREIITMFLVFFPIDIIFLDSKGKIVELKEGLKPFRNYIVENKITSLLELEQGSIRKYRLKKGMVISSK